MIPRHPPARRPRARTHPPAARTARAHTPAAQPGSLALTRTTHRCVARHDCRVAGFTAAQGASASPTPRAGHGAHTPITPHTHHGLCHAETHRPAAQHRPQRECHTSVWRRTPAWAQTVVCAAAACMVGGGVVWRVPRTPARARVWGVPHSAGAPSTLAHTHAFSCPADRPPTTQSARWPNG